jgi:solute carrier family 6 (neurotransmitter transporter, GABA) member 1
LVPYFIALLLIGVPLFIMETAIGQFSGLNPIYLFAKISPLFEGVGYAALILNHFLVFYYVMIIAYSFYYFIFSINSELPWTNCPENVECFKRSNLSSNCSIERDEHYAKWNGIFLKLKIFNF